MLLFSIQDFLQLYNVISDWKPGEDQVLSFHTKVNSSLEMKSVFLRWKVTIQILNNMYNNFSEESGFSYQLLVRLDKHCYLFKTIQCCLHHRLIDLEIFLNRLLSGESSF